MTLVSVIVPIYNVEKYLDQCIQSITKQTYQNLEILLINDGSTDSSGEICKRWKLLDHRIKYIQKRNEGLGPTRNLGIKKANGDYICFIDSDDWIDAKYVEIMYNKLITDNAVICMCDFFRWYNDKKMKQYGNNNNDLGLGFSLNERLRLMSASVWNLLIKRDIFKQYKLEMKNVIGEDFSIYAALLLAGGKVTSVPIGLYYYRQNRPGSICDKKSINHIFLSAQGLIENLKENNLFDQNKDLVFKHISSMFERVLVGSEYWLPINSQKIQEMCESFFCRNFSIDSIPKIIEFGGTNLNRILYKTKFFALPYGRFYFSSIISLMSKKKHKQISISNILYKNKYRKFMIQRDFDKNFQSVVLTDNPDYIFFDFLEERHDLIEIDNAYYTKSDAFDEMISINNDFPIYRIISRFSDECEILWEDACISFVNFLKNNFKSDHVFLIENYLTEKHGDAYSQKTYTNIKEIRKINQLLSKYYRIFLHKFPGVTVIKAYTEELYMTDDNYLYGVYPWHLNEKVNFKIADCIEKTIRGELPS